MSDRSGLGGFLADAMFQTPAGGIYGNDELEQMDEGGGPEGAGIDLSRLVGFDLESTGTDVFEDRIIQAAVVSVVKGKVTDRATWLVDPGVEIPAEATEVHGYTAERLAAEATGTPDQMLFEVTGRLALAMGRVVPIVVANASYDFSMLEAENARHGIDSLASRLLPRPIGPVLDPMVLEKEIDTYRKLCYQAPGCDKATGHHECGGCRGGRAHNCGGCGATDKKLSSLCLHYGITLTDAHDAAADAVAAVELTRFLLTKFAGKFRGLTIGGLHMAQVGWKRKQMDSLRAYFDKNGTEHDGCDPSWPIRVKPVANVAPQGVLL